MTPRNRDNYRYLFSLAITTLAIMIVTPSLAFALAPEPPGIFLQVSPESQDVTAGGSTEFVVNIFPQGQWNSGTVGLEVADAPPGVTVTFDPNPAEVVAEGLSTMTVTVAEDASLGTVTLKILASGTEAGGDKVSRDATVSVNIAAAGPGPGDQQPPGDGESVTVTTTMVSTVTQSIVSTESVITTMTVTNEVTLGPPQDPTLTTATLGIVALAAIILIVAAGLSIAKRR